LIDIGACKERSSGVAAPTSDSPLPQLNPAVAALALPWLQLEAECDSPETLREVEQALFKLALGSPEPVVPTLRAQFELGSAPNAATVWDDGSLKYQFVQGTTDAEGARFATPDGSLLELDFRTHSLTGTLSPSTFTAPYSTWPDLMLAPLTEYWREHGCFPLHAAGVALEDERFVIAGFSGSGKTTLSLACLAGGGTWNADDKLLFRSTPDGARAVSLYRNTNLHPATVAHFEDLAFTLERDSIDETNVKRPCLLEELPLRVDLLPFTPTVLLFPQVTDADLTTVARLAPADTYLRLAAQSPLSTHPPRMRTQVRALAAVAKSLPAFEVRSGRDVLEAPATAAHRLLEAIRAERR
jgi:hypothetical protein